MVWYANEFRQYERQLTPTFLGGDGGGVPVLLAH